MYCPPPPLPTFMEQLWFRDWCTSVRMGNLQNVCIEMKCEKSNVMSRGQVTLCNAFRASSLHYTTLDFHDLNFANLRVVKFVST